MTISSNAPLTKKDFSSDQDIRWCPGCGDYSILSAVQNVLPTLDIPKEKYVFVSGIGCSSRFPYYMNTYGFHTIHGRAPAFATGIKLANPDLSVWVITGDGDALSIGGNHLIHMLRRNVDLNVLLFNNRIYGLTKGQYSPTSEFGKRTKSSPYGSVDHPFNPLSVALGADATFVARTVDIYPAHLKETIARAAAHRGSSFVEIYQNCNIFNDGAFSSMTEKTIRNDQQIELVHGEPMIFGKERDQGLLFRDEGLEVARIGENGVTEADLLVHDEARARPSRAFQLSRMEQPEFPVPIGVFRAVHRPTFDSEMQAQMDHTLDAEGPGKLHELLNEGDVWEV
ncbi:MAG: 2-oxoglutarate ferredoxin oxidoreductase subunit beta [Gemmatimonadota bacterium]|nr:MAG: 2-oxoglutarate ferredoxin oxidoreductase subunit beta [Gemmatimonadota bacterium]